MATPDRRNNFDFVRLVAALCVLVSHQYALSGLPEPGVLVESLGGFGVLVFFSISGFLVTQSWRADPNVWRFGARRLLRIWPGFAVAILLAAFVLGPLLATISTRDYFAHPLLRDYLLNLRFSLRDQLPLEFRGNALPHAINGSLWTIPLELKCYVLIVVLGVAGLLRSKWLVPALTVAASGFMYLVLQPIYAARPDLLGWSVEFRYLVHFGMFFFAGASFSLLRIDQHRRRLLCVLVLAWLLGGVSLVYGSPYLALWFAVPVTVVAVGSASTPYLRQAGRFGDFSYGLYIYAFPVQQTLICLLKEQLPWASQLALTIAVTGLLAFLSWHIVEKTALRLKPRGPRGVGQIRAVGV
jgi:peptidoglycan/LPS O-acetylase OafA/YrhL